MVYNIPPPLCTFLLSLLLFSFFTALFTSPERVWNTVGETDRKTCFLQGQSLEAISAQAPHLQFQKLPLDEPGACSWYLQPVFSTGTDNPN